MVTDEWATAGVALDVGDPLRLRPLRSPLGHLPSFVHAGLPSGRLTSSNVATWVLSIQDSNTAPQISQDTWPLCGIKYAASRRLYSAPHSHRTSVVSILEICARNLPVPVHKASFGGGLEPGTHRCSLHLHLPWLDDQWASGCRNGAELWRRLLLPGDNCNPDDGENNPQPKNSASQRSPA